MSLYGRPSDVVTDGATISLAAGTANSAFPLTNCYDRLAHTVFKSTGATCTVRATFAGATTLEAIAVINTNITALQVTNGAGFNQAVSIPTTPEDGRALDPWRDIRGLANPSSTQWDFAFTAASVVAVGELLLIQTLRDLPIRWNPEEDDEHTTLVHRTDYGVKLKYGFGVRARRVRGSLMASTARALVLSLERDARGQLKNFPLVLDAASNDALFVDLATDGRTIAHVGPDLASVELAFDEQQKGIL